MINRRKDKILVCVFNLTAGNKTKRIETGKRYLLTGT
jgi:hypothetical protein